MRSCCIHNGSAGFNRHTFLLSGFADPHKCGVLWNVGDDFPENMDKKGIDPVFFSSFDALTMKNLDLPLYNERRYPGSSTRIIIQASMEKNFWDGVYGIRKDLVKIQSVPMKCRGSAQKSIFDWQKKGNDP
jgi:hypothetical protein